MYPHLKMLTKHKCPHLKHTNEILAKFQNSDNAQKKINYIFWRAAEILLNKTCTYSSETCIQGKSTPATYINLQLTMWRFPIFIFTNPPWEMAKTLPPLPIKDRGAVETMVNATCPNLWSKRPSIEHSQNFCN